MTVSISDTVKRGKAPKSRYHSFLLAPRYLSEALYREAASKGVTVISLYLDILERGLSLHETSLGLKRYCVRKVNSELRKTAISVREEKITRMKTLKSYHNLLHLG